MKVGESRTRSLSLLCRLLGYTRQAYYQQLGKRECDAFTGMLVIGEVERIRKSQKRIGTRKLHHMMGTFMREHGIGMGRDALFGLLRDHTLLVRRRRSRKPRTTVSCWWKKRYPNLIKGFVPAGPNELWVADITYIRVGEGFCYLSLITDAYSRKIVGWHLRRDLSGLGCLAALKMALTQNPDARGLVHHSDRGLQYYSTRYLKLLSTRGIRVSMSERSDPLENAIAERVNGILKEELLEELFTDLASASSSVAEAVRTYNDLRPHSSIDLFTPAAAHTLSGELKRRWKNYYTGAKQPAAVQPSAYAAA